jgi:hypothetical protein
VLLLAAVFLGHGLQCGSGASGSEHAGHRSDTTVVAAALTVTDPHLMPSDHGTSGAAMSTAAVSDAAHTASAGSSSGHWHGLPGHLWAACLAVLAAGLAVLLLLTAPRLMRLALPAALPAWLRAPSWPAPPRPPDLSSLCVLRI